jgi:outer membrane receptor protein involved in Fe transport
LVKTANWNWAPKSSLATIDNYLIFTKGNVIDPARSVDFEYKENINAAYTSFQHKLDNWEFIAGLRVEQTVAKGKTASAYVLDRNYWQIFPSAFPDEEDQQKLFNCMAIHPPCEQAEFPATESFYPVSRFTYLYTRGNPLLKPELSDAYKISLTYQNQPLFSVSYNRTSDVIFDDAPKQEGNLTYTTPENLAAFENIVFELNFPIQFGKKISGYGGNQFIL